MRALRREKERLKQLQRLRDTGFEPSTERHLGYLRHNHIGCGCMMCKPYKHGMEPALKPSERRLVEEAE